MQLNYGSVKKSLKHGALLSLRVLGLYATYQYLMAPLGIFSAAKTASSISIGAAGSGVISKMAGAALSVAQAPGIYNQFRHFSQHATASVTDNAVMNKLHDLSHQLPHVEGPVTHMKNLYQSFQSERPKAC